MPVTGTFTFKHNANGQISKLALQFIKVLANNSFSFTVNTGPSGFVITLTYWG